MTITIYFIILFSLVMGLPILFCLAASEKDRA